MNQSNWKGDGKQSSSGIMGLHEEIQAFYADIHGTQDELLKREAVIERLAKIVASEYSSASVAHFGSTFTKLFLRTSDIDIVVVVKLSEPPSVGVLQQPRHVFSTRAFEEPRTPSGWLWDFYYLKINKHPQMKRIKMISRAKIPIVKIMDVQTGIHMDVSCFLSTDPCPAIKKSQWIKSAVGRYPALPKLLLPIKELLRRRGLNEIYTGGVNSYVVTLMAVSFLQHNANEQAAIGDLLLGFLKMYGKDFGYAHDAIIVTGSGQIITRSEMRGRITQGTMGMSLSIEDPVEPGKDAAQPSERGVSAARMAFARAHDTLVQAVNRFSVCVGVGNGFLKTIFD